MDLWYSLQRKLQSYLVELIRHGINTELDGLKVA